MINAMEKSRKVGAQRTNGHRKICRKNAMGSTEKERRKVRGKSMKKVKRKGEEIERGEGVMEHVKEIITPE